MLELVAYFLRLGTWGFGGPVALCGLMEKDLVQDRGWLTKEQMRDAIAVSQSLPGPLAIQVGIFISYMRCGFWGAWAGGWAFILPNFLVVAALGAFYVHFGSLVWMSAIFYGVSPAVIALILHSCWRLGKLGMEDRFRWVIAAVSMVVTIAVQAEVAILFIGAGCLGILWYGSLPRFRTTPLAAVAPPIAIGAAPHTASLSLLGKLLVFFLKAGALTFGSGLVIVPFLEKGLVQETHWLNPREFLVAVAIGMLSPGPVVITATFVGYLVAGFWGSLISTVGIFLPSFLLILLVAPILLRHRDNPNVQGFVKGAYAAAIGTILGASILLGKIAIGDWLTALIALGCIVVLFRFKVSNPALIGVTAVIGLIAFPSSDPPGYSSNEGKRRDATTLHGRYAMRAACTIVAVSLLASIAVRAADINWKAVDQAVGKAGTDQPGDVHRVGLPRTDLHVTVDGVELKPAFALGGWLAFKAMGDQAMVMGDLVLTESEINPVMTRLLTDGVSVTAVHNHLLRADPAVFYMHVAAEGDPVKLATSLHDALTASRTPLGSGSAAPPSSSPQAPLAIETEKLDQILGHKGHATGEVYQFSIPRADTITDGGMAIPPAMGTAIGINFQSTDNGRAAITGDFVLKAAEVNPVLQALRQNGIEVTALHNHMLDDQPHAYFIHFWANGDAIKLAQGLRAAVDRVNVAKS